MSKDNADELKRLVHNRTGLEAHQLSCPRERSNMTPCVARDGWMAETADGHCVGCGESVEGLLEAEKLRHIKSDKLTVTVNIKPAETEAIIDRNIALVAAIRDHWHTTLTTDVRPCDRKLYEIVGITYES